MTASSKHALPLLIAAQALAVMPVYLVAAFSPLLRASLMFSDTQLGLAVSTYFLAATIMAAPSGMFVDAYGPRKAIRVAMTFTMLSLLTMALLASTWLHLVLALSVAALSMSLVQPATNVALSVSANPERLGMAFGLKQSSVPIASIAAGLAVPGLADRLGWRATFVVIALACVAYSASCGSIAAKQRSETRPSEAEDLPPRFLFLLAAAIALATAAVSAMSTFFVLSSIASGYSASTAGGLLAFGGLFAVLGRIGAGYVSDRRTGANLRAISLMLIPGSLGVGLLGLVSRNWILLLVVTAIAYAFGWGWNGLFQQAVVKLNPRAPGKASGIASMGLRVGGIAGPTTFGFALAALGYRAAWIGAAASLLLSSAFIALLRSSIRKYRSGPPEALSVPSS